MLSVAASMVLFDVGVVVERGGGANKPRGSVSSCATAHISFAAASARFSLSANGAVVLMLLLLLVVMLVDIGRVSLLLSSVGLRGAGGRTW